MCSAKVTVLFLYCYVINYSKTQGLKTTPFIIPVALGQKYRWYLTEPSLSGSLTMLSSPPGSPGKDLLPSLPAQLLAGSFPSKLLDWDLRSSWVADLRLPLVPCHVALSTEHLKTSLFVLLDQTTDRAKEKEQVGIRLFHKPALKVNYTHLLNSIY